MAQDTKNSCFYCAIFGKVLTLVYFILYSNLWFILCAHSGLRIYTGYAVLIVYRILQNLSKSTKMNNYYSI